MYLRVGDGATEGNCGQAGDGVNEGSSGQAMVLLRRVAASQWCY